MLWLTEERRLDESDADGLEFRLDVKSSVGHHDVTGLEEAANTTKEERLLIGHTAFEALTDEDDRTKTVYADDVLDGVPVFVA